MTDVVERSAAPADVPSRRGTATGASVRTASAFFAPTHSRRDSRLFKRTVGAHGRESRRVLKHNAMEAVSD